jgi:hypothetical protein
MPLRISPAASRNTDYPLSANVYLIFNRTLCQIWNKSTFFRAIWNEDCRLCVQQVWAPSHIVGHCSGDNEDIAVFRDVPMPSVVEKHSWCLLQTADFFETSVHFYQRTWHHIPYRWIESLWHEIFRDWPQGPPTLLYNAYRVFLGAIAAGVWC